MRNWASYLKSSRACNNDHAAGLADAGNRAHNRPVSTPEPDLEKMDRCDTQLRTIYEAVWSLEQQRDALISAEKNKEIDGLQVSIAALREQARVIGEELDVLVAASIERDSHSKEQRDCPRNLSQK